MPNEDFGTREWFNSQPGELWSDLVGDRPDAALDIRGLILYQEAYFDQEILTPDRVMAREALESYMWDEYGIDFEVEFDWYGWREFMGYD